MIEIHEKTDRWNQLVTQAIDKATNGLCFLVDWFDRMDGEARVMLAVGTYESRDFQDELLALTERITGLIGEPIRIVLLRGAWEEIVPVVAMPSIQMEPIE